MLALFLVPVGIGALLSLLALPAWLRATRAGAQLTVFEVVGMKLRRIDVDSIANAMSIADEHGLPVSHVELQEAWQRGINLERALVAWAETIETNPEARFADVAYQSLNPRS